LDDKKQNPKTRTKGSTRPYDFQVLKLTKSTLNIYFLAKLQEETNQEIMNGIPLPCVRRFFDASVREEKTCVATVGRYRKKEVILVTSVLNINTPL